MTEAKVEMTEAKVEMIETIVEMTNDNRNNKIIVEITKSVIPTKSSLDHALSMNFRILYAAIYGIYNC
jgi:hypothetical protein